eukprot:Awhi_evm1s6615
MVFSQIHHHGHHQNGCSPGDVEEDTAISESEVNDNIIVRAFYEHMKKNGERFIDEKINIPVMMGRSLRVTAQS